MTPDEITAMRHDIDVIKQREMAASAGTWAVEELGVGYEVIRAGTTALDQRIARVIKREDALFIAGSRQDIPRLLSYLQRLLAEVDIGQGTG
jgi:hypothetical protein